MTKIFMMRVSLDIAVAAEDVSHAHDCLDRYTIRDAFSDSSDDCFDVDLVKEITKLEELKPHNWDGMCIPYGATDGNTRLKDILKESGDV
jgi:hypothetical protein